MQDTVKVASRRATSARGPQRNGGVRSPPIRRDSMVHFRMWKYKSASGVGTLAVLSHAAALGQERVKVRAWLHAG